MGPNELYKKFTYVGILGNAIEYSGLLLGVAGIVDDVNLTKIIGGGIAYVCGRGIDKSSDKIKSFLEEIITRR